MVKGLRDKGQRGVGTREGAWGVHPEGFIHEGLIA